MTSTDSLIATRRAAIYTRISLDQTGEGLGVQRQSDDCAELAARLGWDVVTTFTDNDVSAFSGKRRDGFEAMLDGLKNGQFDGLICWHTDRLYRTLKDLVRLLEVAGGVDIRTVRGGDLDLSTASGRMVATILGSVAVQESEHKGERQRRANAQKAAAGKWLSANRSFGYTVDGEPLEPEASAVRQAVVDVLGGKSVQAVAREWNAKGLKTTLAGQQRKDPKDRTGVAVKVLDGKWNSPRVRRVLINPRYAGLRTHNGKVVGPGDWTALVDEDTHRGLVAYLCDPARIICTTWERKYIGSGLYRCGKCGGTMKAAQPGGTKASGRPNRVSRAYACRDHAHVLRSGEPVDAYVVAEVLQRLSAPDAQLMLDTPVDLTGLQTKRTALQERLDELASLFADGTIEGSQLRRGSTEIRAKLAVLDGQLADATRTSPTAALLAAGDRLHERWQQLTPTQRAQVVDEIAVVTIEPCPRGLRRFSEDYVTVRFRRDE